MKLASVPIHSNEPWNKDKLIGQKAPLKPKEIWAIRIRLQLAERTRDPALFNLAIDSKLRGCDLLESRRHLARKQHSAKSSRHAAKDLSAGSV